MKTCTCKSNIIQPDTQCLICAEKHFSGAYKLHTEAHYTAINRHAVIGDLKLCADHLDRDYPAFADKIRELRHKISYRREKETDSNIFPEKARLSGDSLVKITHDILFSAEGPAPRPGYRR